MGEKTGRRQFLRGMAGVLTVGGFADSAAGQARATRRMVYQHPPSLSDDHVGRVIIITNRREQGPGQLPASIPPGASECAFGNEWPPEDPNAYRGMLVEWRGGTIGRVFDGREVQAEKIVQRELVVERHEPPIELGMTFIITEAVSCPDGLVGVKVNEVPGLRIRTGSDGEKTARRT